MHSKECSPSSGGFSETSLGQEDVEMRDEHFAQKLNESDARVSPGSMGWLVARSGATSSMPTSLT